jgi:hypothetical protein
MMTWTPFGFGVFLRSDQMRHDMDMLKPFVMNGKGGMHQQGVVNAFGVFPTLIRRFCSYYSTALELMFGVY